MTIDLLGKYIETIPGGVSVKSELGTVFRGSDDYTYMRDNTGHAWRLSHMQSGDVSRPSGGASMVGGAEAMDDPVEFLERIRWATIEDPSTAQIVDDNDNASGVAKPIGESDLKKTLPFNITVVHPFGYAYNPDREGFQDYCVRKEELISLSGNGPPTLQDFLDLVHCMTLHYKGSHGVYLKTDVCQPKVWPAHLGKLIAFSGVSEQLQGGSRTWTIECKSISQTSYPSDFIEGFGRMAALAP